MTLAPNPKGDLRQQPDGTWELRCPGCGKWGDLVSCDHTHTDHQGNVACTFHETRDWLNTADRIQE